jgi:hypothetical protein
MWRLWKRNDVAYVGHVGMASLSLPQWPWIYTPAVCSNSIARDEVRGKYFNHFTKNGLFDCHFRTLLRLTRQMLYARVQHFPECLKKLDA